MMDDEERRFVRDCVAGMREPPPAWVNREDRRGKEHIGPNDVWWPNARGLEPYGKLLRRELAREFRQRADGGPVPVERATFVNVRKAIKIRAFPTRRTQTPAERICAIQRVAKERLTLDVPDQAVGRRLDRRETPHQLARWLLALAEGVSPRRLRIPRKPQPSSRQIDTFGRREPREPRGVI